MTSRKDRPIFVDVDHEQDWPRPKPGPDPTRSKEPVTVADRRLYAALTGHK